MATTGVLTLAFLTILWTTGSYSERGPHVTIREYPSDPVQVGEKVTLLCVGSRNARLVWYHGLEEIHILSGSRYSTVQYIENNQLRSSLVIEDVNFNDAGSYTCQNSHHSNIKDSADLQVTARPLHIEDGQEVRDSRVLVKCRATQGTELEWLHDGELVQLPTTGIDILTQEDREKRETVSVLRLGVNTEYSGNYTCRDATNRNSTDTVFLTVPTTPTPTRTRIEITTANLTVTEGEMISIECRGNMNASLYWTHNDVRLLPGGDVIMMTTMTTSGEQVMSVGMMSASVQWAGKYGCHDHGDGTNEDFVHVNVIRSRPDSRIRITSNHTVNIPPGSDFTVRCTAGRDASLFWTHNDLPLVPGEGLVIMTTMTQSGRQLTAVTVTYADSQFSGTYSCRDYRDSTNMDSAVITIEPEQLVSPVRILSPLAEHVYVQYGEAFALICAGSPTTHPTWYHNDQPVGYQRNVLVTNTIDVITQDLVVVLTRLSPNAGASGIYSCRDGDNAETSVNREVIVGRRRSVSGRDS